MKVKPVICGDAIEVLQQMPDNCIDAVVTDPPYGLEFMGKEWDSFRDVSRANRGTQPNRKRPPGEAGTSQKFQLPSPAFDLSPAAKHAFQAWCQLWATECLRVLKPGGHLLAFGGTRTSHRLACAIEDAGFEIRDSIAWLYGCLSDDTEVLTSEGWVRYDRATEGQHALAFDTTTGDLEWQPIQHVHRYWHDGEMVRLHSDETDQLLTPNHRVVLDDEHTEPRVPYAGDMRDLWDRVLEAERLGQKDQGALLLLPVQRGSAGSGVGEAGLQGLCGQDSGEPGKVRHAGREEPRLEGRRYRVQEAWELCRGQVRASAGVGASDGPQGRLHHGAPSSDGGSLRLLDDSAGSRQPREPRPEGQPTGELDALAVEPGAQTLRVGEDGGRSVLPSTPVTADLVGYAGVVWCITVPHGAFIARRNGLIFATGNSGFPKSLDVSKAIDKANGRAFEDRPATDDARTWQGWGTALKPAHEPIVVARKPLTGTVAANVLEHGTGAINVDGCRVGDGGEVLTGGGGKLWSHYRDSTEDQAAPKVNTGGRWPANVVLDEEMAEVLDQQTGELTSGSGNTRRKPHQTTSMAGTLNILGEEEVSYGDTGGASRFFKVVSEDATGLPIDDVEERFKYTAKAGKKERPVIMRDGKKVSHPTVKPLALMRYLVRLVTPPGGIVLDPFAGSGTTGEAAKLEGFRSILIEKDPDYIDLIKQRLTKGS